MRNKSNDNIEDEEDKGLPGWFEILKSLMKKE